MYSFFMYIMIVSCFITLTAIIMLHNYPRKKILIEKRTNGFYKSWEWLMPPRDLLNDFGKKLDTTYKIFFPLTLLSFFLAVYFE